MNCVGVLSKTNWNIQPVFDPNVRRNSWYPILKFQYLDMMNWMLFYFWLFGLSGSYVSPPTYHLSKWELPLHKLMQAPLALIQKQPSIKPEKKWSTSSKCQVSLFLSSFFFFLKNSASVMLNLAKMSSPRTWPTRESTSDRCSILVTARSDNWVNNVVSLYWPPVWLPATLYGHRHFQYGTAFKP